MNTTKIIELFIDDMEDESGIEAISLVSRPAHDEKWLAFNKETPEEVEEFNPYRIVDEDFCSHQTQLDLLGEPYSKLIDEGWEIVRVEKITPAEVYRMNRESFSNPNAESVEDVNSPYRIRYKYVGPRDNKNREFCREMLNKNRVYRIEDIEQLSNPDFGVYDVFLWRGSFNCRHVWVRLLYKKEGNINNNAGSRKGLIETQGLGPTLQPDTRNLNTINTAEIGETKAGIPVSRTQWRPGVPRQGSFAQDYYFQDSINDYPEGVKNAAKKVIDFTEKNGWGGCGTGVGKQRANQLAKGENISIDTVKRMYNYLSRHKVDLESSKSYTDGCGKLMYDAWGGEAGLKWSERKLAQLEKEKMSQKALSIDDMNNWNGTSVETKKLFFLDDEKKIIVGAAMVPNKMIHRYDSLGNLYYVFFSKTSIKKMADKFMKQKRTDETSVEHDGMKLGADKVWITESWVSEDPEKDKSANYGFNLPAGTWFVSMKVEDPKVWDMVKKKALTGFSVEGLFAEKSIFSKEKINRK